MNHWHSIRKRANEIHTGLFALDESAEKQLNAEEILCRLENQTGISRQPVGKNNPILQKAVALIIPDFEALFFNDELPSWYAAFCQAHEYAHLFLHHEGQIHCTKTDIEFTGSEENSIPTGENRISSYSARERREREANLFAAELLLPSRLIRHLFIEKGWRASDFALKTGLPFDFVCRQLNFALFVSAAVMESEEESQSQGEKSLKLDPSQERAAHFNGQRLLVEAGPGTGKTRTLVGRILYLLEKGVAAENILALTFSNKAADEMRERISIYAPGDAAKIWLGTFHAFGLETLRKFGEKIEIKADFELLDPIDAQILLENHLLELNLEHYKSLHFPAQNLKSIHTAIQRAKDELISFNDYDREAQEMLNFAESPEEILTAEKALEIARIYRFYEGLLMENKWLDFGDLIYRAVLLLEKDDHTKHQLQAKYTHLLVDEFQDVNRASSRFLKELTGEQGNLWIVGDARQSVYRWRGASSTNLKYFREDFPEADSLSLEINYRSEKPIVNLLNELAPKVTSSANNKDFTDWDVPEEKQHNGKGIINYTEAPDFATECEQITQDILEQKANRRNFKEIAVLARTNNILAKIADQLIEREIPVLYLGNMFERAEIRDLLSLLSLTSLNRGRHLLRLTQFPEYDFATEEVRRLIATAEKAEQTFPAAFVLAQTDNELSDEIKDKFALLAEHLEDLDETVSAWQFFSTYLFDRSDYLLPILRKDSVAARQQHFAIYQLLQFALSEEGKSTKVRAQETNPRLQFLRLIRHLAQSGEESAFRKLPAWAENIDAVRLLTVHAAKGLEFPSVFIPYLGNAYFPNKKQTTVCPLPKSFLADIECDDKSEHEEEELCLFFVALSRAKENLYLSRAQNYGSVSKHSRFLELIPKNLPESVKPATILSDKEDLLSVLMKDQTDNQVERYAYSFSEIKTYHTCPRRYFYEYILNLRGDLDGAAFVQFHGVVGEVISWAKNQSVLGVEVSDAAARGKLFELWQGKPISLHAYSPLYLKEAEILVVRAAKFFSHQINKKENSTVATTSLEFSIGGKRIRLRPDILEISPDDSTIKVQKIKTGRSKQKFADLSDDEKLNLAALFQAASESYPEAKVSASFEYIAQDESFLYDPKNIKTQLEHLKRAIDGIATRRFEVKKDSQKCPRCAHYFICPGGDL